MQIKRPDVDLSVKMMVSGIESYCYYVVVKEITTCCLFINIVLDFELFSYIRSFVLSSKFIPESLICSVVQLAFKPHCTVLIIVNEMWFKSECLNLRSLLMKDFRKKQSNGYTKFSFDDHKGLFTCNVFLARVRHSFYCHQNWYNAKH